MSLLLFSVVNLAFLQYVFSVLTFALCLYCFFILLLDIFTIIYNLIYSAQHCNFNFFSVKLCRLPNFFNIRYWYFFLTILGRCDFLSSKLIAALAHFLDKMKHKLAFLRKRMKDYAEIGTNITKCILIKSSVVLRMQFTVSFVSFTLM